MKVSVNWLRQFTDIDMSIDELVAKIGAQLGAVDEVTDLGKKYQGILIAKVISCEKHPNADKLSVCWIDDGGKAEGIERNDSGHVQVVCGAPNVREGLTVAWLPPGSTVPSTFEKDPFVLGARELRGVVSNGMLASAAELAIGDDHDGIVEIDIDADPGTDFADLYELNDHIIDIENKMFTHRPDCFGILGVAREIAGIQHNAFISPDWYKTPLDRIKPGATRLELSIKNEITDKVPRFMAIAMADVTVKPSPLIIQTYLSRVGLRPINNVVDVTNYLMVLTGQPTHAYDYDKLPGKSLETRLSRNGDKLKLLTGKEIELTDDSTILITSNDVPVGVGGVMGGADTEVSKETKNIVIECANFDMYSIRRTSMKYGLFTDAVTRFNKGQSPMQNDIILEEAVATMQYVGGAHVASEVYDVKKQDLTTHVSVEVSSDFINVRLGANLATEDMARLLENVEFTVDVHGDTLRVTPPYWRTDIEIAEDVVEEIGRLYGFDSLPIELPKRPIVATKPNEKTALKRQLRTILASAGANEVLTYSFVHGNLLKKSGQDPDKAYRLSNAISPDLQYYRLSLTPSLLDKVHANVKSGISEFAMFEIGKAHTKGLIDSDEPQVPGEEERIALVFAADDKVSKAYKGAPYYMARKYLDVLMQKLHITYEVKSLDHEPTNEEGEQLLKPFDPGRTGVVEVNGAWVGCIAEPSQSVRKTLKLPEYTAVFELDIERLLQSVARDTYRALSKYPKVQQDISLKVKKDQPYGEIYSFIFENLEIPENCYADLLPLDIYEKGDSKHITLRLQIASYVKTLTDTEVNALLDEVADKASRRFGAERI